MAGDPISTPAIKQITGLSENPEKKQQRAKDLSMYRIMLKKYLHQKKVNGRSTEDLLKIREGQLESCLHYQKDPIRSDMNNPGSYSHFEKKLKMRGIPRSTMKIPSRLLEIKKIN